MDAAKLPSLRTVFLFITAALLSSAAVYAQTPAFNLNNSGTTATAFPPSSGLPTSVAVSSSTSTNITYQATTAYSNGDRPWLCINGPNCSSAGADQQTGLTTPNTLAISLGQQAGLLSGNVQHTATITLTATSPSGVSPGTITVLYTPGQAGSGAGTITASALSISSSSSCGGIAYFTNLSLSTTSASPISFALSTGQAWDSVSPITGTVVAGFPTTLDVVMNGSGQQCTQLSDFITVAYNGTSFNISVTFGNGVAVNGGGGSTGSLTASLNPVSLAYVSNSNNFPSQFVTISGNAGVTFNAVASSSTNWLLVNSNTQINTIAVPAQVLISANSNAQNLPTGASSGTVTFFGSDGSELTLTVNLAVNGPNNTGITISPNPVPISAAFNGSSTTQAVTITSTLGGAVSATISGTGLSVSSPSNTNLAPGGSTSVTVTANPTGLSNAQTYTGTLSVTVGSQTLTALVNFTVGSGSSNGGTGSIAAAPSSLSFVYQANVGAAAPASQTILLTGAGSYTANPTTQNGGQWLSVFPQSGTLPASSFSVSVNPTSLQAGTYSGAVTFTNSSSGTTSVVSVTLNVYNSAAIYASPGDVIFNFVGNTTTAQFQDLSLIGTSGALTTSLAVSNPTNTPWLTVSQSSSPGIFFVTVNASSLANGVYTGYLSATATGAANSPLSIPVAVNVTGSSVSGGSGNLTLSPSSLNFQAAVGGSASPQQLTVGASTATNFTASASTNGNGNNTWLSISPSGSLTTNATITVTANAAGLAAGTYNGTITLISTSGTQTVGVTMVVGGSGTGGTLSVSVNGGSATTSPSVSFTANSVGASVNSQYITVSSASGASGISFSATLSGTSCAWVNLGIAQNQAYQTPVNIPIGATTTGLAAGTYNCTLTLAPSGGGAATTVPLSLTVVGAPSISFPTTTLSFSYAAGSAPPSSQTVQLTNPGSAAASFTAAASVTAPSGGTWLTVTPASGSVTPGTPFTLTVNVSPSGLNAGTYNGTITLTAGTGATGSGTIPVTLVVSAPTPAVTNIVNAASSLSNNNSVAPGEVVSILGSSLGPLTPVAASIGSNGNVTSSAGGVQVLFDATPAPLTYVSSGQINCVVPYEVNGLSTVTVTVQYLGVSSNSTTLTVVATAPGIFSANASGSGGGAILNQNSQLNTSANPAPKGSVIQIYLTGEGITNPQQADGALTPYPPATVPVATPITVTIGGQPATYTFYGEAPGLIAGVMQINVIVPPGATSGSANPVVVTVGHASSQANLTVAVQ